MRTPSWLAALGRARRDLVQVIRTAADEQQLATPAADLVASLPPDAPQIVDGRRIDDEG